MATKKEKDAALLAKFATVMGCKPAFVGTRLLVLGHGVPCGRCGGTGEYSYCQMYGTTCFGCMGKREAAPKLTEALLAKVTEQVAAGELVPYIERLKRKAKVKGYSDKMFAAWGANPTVAAHEGVHFTKQSARNASINHFCHELMNEERKLTGLVTNGRWTPNDPKSPKGKGHYVPLTDAEVDAALNRLDEILVLVGNAETLAPDVVWCDKANAFVPVPAPTP